MIVFLRVPCSSLIYKYGKPVQQYWSLSPKDSMRASTSADSEASLGQEGLESFALSFGFQKSALIYKVYEIQWQGHEPK